MWRCSATSATVRINGRGGFTFPVVSRHEVEPVSPDVAEALAQGVAAAAAGSVHSVVLWVCHLREHEHPGQAARLEALLR